MVQVRNQREVNQSRSVGGDESHADFTLGCSELDVVRRKRAAAAAGRITVGFSEDRGYRHAPCAHPNVDRLLPQRRQEVCEPRLPHPVGQIQRIATPNQQCVRLLDHRNPSFLTDTGQRGELQHSQRPPAQLAQGALGFSADRLPCHASTAGEGIYRGRNEKSTGFGNRFAQQLDQRVMDASVINASGSEEKPHRALP